MEFGSKHKPTQVGDKMRSISIIDTYEREDKYNSKNILIELTNQGLHESLNNL